MRRLSLLLAASLLVSCGAQELDLSRVPGARAPTPVASPVSLPEIPKNDLLEFALWIEHVPLGSQGARVDVLDVGQTNDNRAIYLTVLPDYDAEDIGPDVTKNWWDTVLDQFQERFPNQSLVAGQVYVLEGYGPAPGGYTKQGVYILGVYREFRQENLATVYRVNGLEWDLTWLIANSLARTLNETLDPADLRLLGLGNRGPSQVPSPRAEPTSETNQ